MVNTQISNSLSKGYHYWFRNFERAKLIASVLKKGNEDRKPQLKIILNNFNYYK